MYPCILSAEIENGEGGGDGDVGGSFTLIFKVILTIQTQNFRKFGFSMQ